MKLRSMALASSISVSLVACAASPPPKNASDLEPVVGESSTQSADLAAPAPKAGSAGAAAGDAAPADAPAEAAPKVDAKPLGPTTLKGKVSGGDFHPAVALIHTPTFGDSVMVEIFDREATCDDVPAAADGHRVVEVKVPWKAGPHAVAPEKAQVRFGLQMKGKALWGDAKSGTVTVLEAPREQGAIGRLRLDVQAPKEKVSGEIDVHVCVAPR